MTEQPIDPTSWTDPEDPSQRLRADLYRRIQADGYAWVRTPLEGERAGAIVLYTIGMRQHAGLPELALTNCSPQVATTMVDAVLRGKEEGHDIPARRRPAGVITNVLADDHPIWMLPVDDLDPFTAGHWWADMHDEQLEVTQIVLGDAERRPAWHPDVDPKYAVPLLAPSPGEPRDWSA